MQSHMVDTCRLHLRSLSSHIYLPVRNGRKSFGCTSRLSQMQPKFQIQLIWLTNSQHS